MEDGTCHFFSSLWIRCGYVLFGNGGNFRFFQDRPLLERRSDKGKNTRYASCVQSSMPRVQSSKADHGVRVDHITKKKTIIHAQGKNACLFRLSLPYRMASSCHGSGDRSRWPVPRGQWAPGLRYRRHCTAQPKMEGERQLDQEGEGEQKRRRLCLGIWFSFVQWLVYKLKNTFVERKVES